MADKPQIILFSHVANSRSITGAEKLLLFFAKELSAFYDCTLAAPQEGKLTRLARAAGLRVELIGIPLLYGIYTPYAGLELDAKKLTQGKEYRELRQWLAERRPDLIVTSTCVHALPAIAAKSLGIPVIWKISETITDNEYQAVSADFILRYSDEIIAISRTAASPFPQEFIDGGKIRLLPPSWNEAELMVEAWSKLRSERRRELRVKPGQPLIGYISSFIIKEKGLEHFVKMAVGVAARYPEARFLVIGEPGEQTFYDRCVRKVKLEGLTSRFRFAGYEDCLPAAYSAMDALVVPSLVREGFGMTALEGLACGKPVIAYGSGGLREILEAAGREDWIAPTGEPEALAEAVCALLTQPNLAAQGMAARELAAASFGPAAYRARLAELAAGWTQRYVRPPGAAPAVMPVAEPGLTPADAAQAAAPDAAGGGMPAAPEAPPSADAAPPAASRRARKRRLQRTRLRRGRLRRSRVRARRRGRSARPAKRTRQAAARKRGAARKRAGVRKRKRAGGARRSRRRSRRSA